MVKMWKLVSNNSSFFIYFTQNYDYEIFITDYLTLWFVRLSESGFLNSLKDSNTTLEIDENSLKRKGIHMLLNPDKLRKADIKINGQTMQVSMSMSFGYLIKFNLRLTEASKEMFFQKVTQPLLKMLQELKSSENELRLLLKKKDVEIEEYKSEGAQVVRHFKTPKYNEEQHMNQYKAYVENFGASEIPSSILERSVELPENKVIKEEPVSIKVEPMEPTEPAIKMEPESQPTFNNIIVQATASVKREHIKTERNTVSDDPRTKRRARLNL